MATTKNAVYKVHNGTDFDTIHFETGENNLVNVGQLLTGNGYRKFPGGLILQWGYVYFPNGRTGHYENTISFPIAFPNSVFAINLQLTENGVEYHHNEITSVKSDTVTNTQFIYRSYQDDVGYSGKCFWIALGN